MSVSKNAEAADNLLTMAEDLLALPDRDFGERDGVRAAGLALAGIGRALMALGGEKLGKVL